jgi:hypothetical protein
VWSKPAEERPVFVRMPAPAPDGSGTTAETHFNRCQKGWISIEVVIKMKGEVVTMAEYADLPLLTCPEIPRPGPADRTR